MTAMPKGLHARIDDLRPPWATGGMPVVLHHGIGTNLGIWSEWVPTLAGRHQVVRFDMRGFGRSPVPLLDHGWTMDELVDDVWAVADLAEQERVHLVGESMGGTIVLAAACARPERVASVHISNASFKGKGLGELAYWRKQFADGGPAGWSRRMMENRFEPGSLEPAAWGWFEAEQAKTHPHVAVGLGGVLAGSDLSEKLKSFPRPISVALPNESPFVPVEHGHELEQLAPDVRLRVVHGVRHGLPFSHASSESRSLLGFLQEVENS